MTQSRIRKSSLPPNLKDIKHPYMFVAPGGNWHAVIKINKRRWHRSMLTPDRALARIRALHYKRSLWLLAHSAQ